MIALDMPARARPLALVVVDKHIATLQARAALAGALLVQIEADDGGPAWVLTRDALTAQFSPERFASLEAVVSMLEDGACVTLQGVRG